jgi:hypothetical protein
MSPRTIYLSRLIGLFTLVVTASMIVLAHQVWRGGTLPVVVTLLGWMILLRGVVLLLLSQPATVRLVAWFRFDELFYLYLGLAVALGVYLTILGFLASDAMRRA